VDSIWRDFRFLGVLGELRTCPPFAFTEWADGRWEVNEEVLPRAWRIDIRGEGSVTYLSALNYRRGFTFERSRPADN
jgi:hypothetical protein